MTLCRYLLFRYGLVLVVRIVQFIAMYDVRNFNNIFY